MATTDIHAITQTVEQSVDYITRDKKELFLKDDIADSIAYVMNDKTGEVTYFTLSSTLNCSDLKNPAADFNALIYTYGKEELEHGNPKTKDGKPILAWHLIQSFEGEVNPVTANEIGRKLADELFPGHPVVISTHTNTENTHNHIEFCAWNLDGKKWNQCNENYQRIRECSDRLCDEYGLSVLEHTRQQKLIRWEDSEGKVHYFEPTDRKIEMIRARENEEVSPDDVGSYRNTLAYQVSELRKETNAAIIKNAIDDCLPHATSYEHLLFMLREQGFKIRDKKKNGDWMEHITFTPPTADKGVRDYKISEDGYYTRESLTAIIDERNAERRRSESEQKRQNVPYYESYVYGQVDVQAINEDYRADRAGDGTLKIVRRGEAEKSIIQDVKAADMDLASRFNMDRLRELAEEQEQAKRYHRSPRNHDEALVRQIQEGFENLRFIERKQLYSYAQINGIVKGLWSQYNACLEKIGQAEEMIQRLDAVVKAPDILREAMTRIERGQNNTEYMMENYQKDARLVKACAAAIEKHHLNDSGSATKLRESVEKYRAQINGLQASLTAFSTELAEYNRCVITLARIDRSSGRDTGVLLAEYEAIVKAGKEQADQANDKRKKQGQER